METKSSRYDAVCTASEQDDGNKVELAISGTPIFSITYKSPDLFEVVTNPESEDQMNSYLANGTLVQTLATLVAKLPKGAKTESSDFNFAGAKQTLMDALNTIEAENGEGEPDITAFAELVKEIVVETYGSHNIMKFLDVYRKHQLAE